MNEVGPPRSPLSRAAPVLAVGLALVLAGGFAVGIFVGRKPPPDTSPAADQVLPPPTPAAVTVPVVPPVIVPVAPSPPPAPPPVPVASPPPAPAVAPAPPPAKPVPAKTQPPTPVATKLSPPPPAPVAAPAKPVPAATRPPRDSRPGHKSAQPAHPKPEAASPRHKPESGHALPRPVDGGRWIVQLGAFQSDDHAKLLVDTLAYHGHPARIAGGHDRNGHDWYYVQTPGYATRREAESVARTLQRDQHMPTYVFETHRPPGG